MNKNLKDWIGREEICKDVIDELRIKQALSFINTKIENNNLPILFHLFFANNISRLDILDHEGHEKLGNFIPEVKKYGDFSKRMWASGSFILAIIANTVFAFSDQTINIFQISSQAFLLFGLFCIGSQFDSNEIKSITGKPLILALMLWAFVIPSAYFLVKYF